MDNVTKHQTNIPCCEALEKILVYAKIMKGLLTRKIKLKCDENIALKKEYSCNHPKKTSIKA